MTLHELKLKIWTHPRIHRNPIDLQVFADRAQVRLPITQIHEAEKLLKSLARKVKKKVETPGWCIERYNAAHKAWFAIQFPHATKDGHYEGMEPDWPDLGTGNGINKFISNYLFWKGHRATRINVQGRMIGDVRIKSSTRKGSADISSTIFGRSVQWEGKAGKDKPRPEQLREQEIERKAGGEYFFVNSAEDFFNQYDSLSSRPKQTTLL